MAVFYTRFDERMKPGIKDAHLELGDFLGNLKEE